MSNRKAVIPCWSCGANVELKSTVCAKCGDQLPARGTPGGKIGVMWKMVVRLSDQVRADPSVLETAAQQYGMTPDELNQAIEIMKGRVGADS